MFSISKEVLSCTKMTSSSKLILSYLESTVKHTPQLSYETIADAVGIKTIAASNGVRYLVDNGYIFRDKNEKGWYVYFLKETNA